MGLFECTNKNAVLMTNNTILFGVIFLSGWGGVGEECDQENQVFFSTERTVSSLETRMTKEQEK